MNTKRCNLTSIGLLLVSTSFGVGFFYGIQESIKAVARDESDKRIFKDLLRTAGYPQSHSCCCIIDRTPHIIKEIYRD